MKLSARTAWLCLVVLLALMACSTPRPGSRFPNVVVYGKQIQIDDARSHTLADGSLEVVVRGYSNSRFDRPVRYRALWNDSAGRPIQTTVSNWFPLNLQGERPFDLTMIGPGDRAVGYRVEIEVLEE
jgi:uncharacterized protein YcfL